MAKPTADVDMHALRAEMQRALDVAAHLCDRLRQLSVPSRQLHDRLLFLLPKLPTVESSESWVTSDAVVRYVRIVESFVALVRLSDSLSTIKRGLMQRKLVHELQSLNGEVDDVARELFTATATSNDGDNAAVSQESRACMRVSELARFLLEGTTDLALRQLRYVTLDVKMRGFAMELHVLQPLLRLVDVGDDWQKEFACRTLRNLTLDENACKRVSEEPQDVALLVEVIAKNLTDAVKEHATGVLLNLTCFDVASMKVVADCGGVAALVGLVASGTYRQKEVACGVLHNMASCVGLEAVGAFVNAIADGSERRQAYIVGTLCVVARTRGGREAIVSSGGIDLLVDIVRRGQNDDCVESVVNILHLVSGDAGVSVGAIIEARAIAPLVALMESGSEKVVEYAVGTLAHLAERGCAGEVCEAGGASPVVRLLQNGTKIQREYACRTLESVMGRVNMWQFVFDAFPVGFLVWSAASENTKARALALKILSAQVAGQVDKVKSEFQKALVDSGLVPVLAGLLQCGTMDEKNIAADLVFCVTKYNHEAKALAAQAGLVSPLVAWIKSNSPTYDTLRTGIPALASLSILPEVRAEMWRAGALEPLADSLKERSGSSMQREYLCAIIRNLSIDSDYRDALRDVGCIEQLVLLVEHDRVWAYDKEREHSAVALRNLALGNDENKAAIEEAGGVKALCRFLRDDEIECGKSDTIAALWSLADTPARRAAIREEFGLWQICSLVESDKNLDKEVGLGALLALSIEDPENKEAIGSRGGALSELMKLFWDGTDSLKASAASVLQSLAMVPRVGQAVKARARAAALYQLARVHSGDAAKKLYQLASVYSREEHRTEAAALDILHELSRIHADLTGESGGRFERNLLVDELVAEPREILFHEPGVGSPAEDTSWDRT